MFMRLIFSMLMTITATIGTLLLLGLATAVLPFLELDPDKEPLRCPQPEETFQWLQFQLTKCRTWNFNSPGPRPPSLVGGGFDLVVSRLLCPPPPSWQAPPGLLPPSCQAPPHLLLPILTPSSSPPRPLPPTPWWTGDFRELHTKKFMVLSFRWVCQSNACALNQWLKWWAEETKVMGQRPSEGIPFSLSRWPCLILFHHVSQCLTLSHSTLHPFPPLGGRVGEGGGGGTILMHLGPQ